MCLETYNSYYSNFKKFDIEDLTCYDTIAYDLEERFNYSFYNIGKRVESFDNFELHRAVFLNDLMVIRKICAVEM